MQEQYTADVTLNVFVRISATQKLITSKQHASSPARNIF